MAKKDEKKETMVAECEITSPLGTERVKSFDTGWHRMLEIAKHHTPVSCTFVGFIRKDL